MSEHPPARVMLVDDHDLVREALRLRLEQEPDLEVVAEAATGEGALELAERLAVDVVLMDVRMPGMGGVEATRMLKALRPNVRVLMLSAYPEFAVDALTAGAAGYVLKSGDSRQLVAALRSVALGSMVIQADLVPAVLGTGGHPSRPTGLLSHREVDILRLIAHGLTNRAIARQVGIAPRTADQHVHNIFVKVGVTSRSAAVRYAIEHELIPRAAGSSGTPS